LPAHLLILKDDIIELKSNEFESRKAVLDFSIQVPNSSGTPQDPRWGVLSFNISVNNATSFVNIVVKAGGVELQRYSLTNQPMHAIQEVVIPQGGNIKAGGNVIEFEITDTPTTETGIIRISDVVLWIVTVQ
jgi:hypothetical protein